MSHGLWGRIYLGIGSYSLLEPIEESAPWFDHHEAGSRQIFPHILSGFPEGTASTVLHGEDC